ncbi:hypothetical protein [Gluconacetobacter diazotrophicus]|uniref:Uncharacterized protein n=1 Tax=Gluconacetobacter diazotrophicus (strain ATCC 49037 / DSM 5601 / CCUG 37298 / CIP 103539 / LMG 7603 / PAl5) TaxID=272568 RepID=A9H6I8_GLUDA|nr:hypothetical protein [Gluconacetobacter diazotrophicus]CAP57502.1 conserved hypothetical protein [Gluconacetobacter diazotrophicus PA1 5]
MTGLISDLKARIILPVLTALALPGDPVARLQLATGIGNAETGYRTKVQSGGPALGFWQAEPATHDDVWLRSLPAHPDIGRVLLGYLPARFGGRPIGAAEAMVECDAYAAGVAAVVFFRSPVPLPPRDDPVAQCAAWKRGYNTALGAGAVDRAHIALFQQAIDA